MTGLLEHGKSRLLWLLVLAVGFALQVAWRLHLSLPLTGPVAHYDEDGYLFGARMLAGGPLATLPSASIMRPMGYPLLLAPIYWFVQQPVQVYVGVHIVNALLMSANFPLLYLLGRRLFDTGRAWTAAVAFVLAALPSLVYFGEFALTDALLPEILTLLLLALHGMLTGRRRLLAGAAAGAVAGYAANTHVRGLVMLVVLGGLVAIGVWRRWVTWTVAAATAASAVVVYAIGYVVDAWLENLFFSGHGAFQVDGRVLDRLTSLQGLHRVLADGFGQIWYLSTSTYGLAGIGIAATVVMLVRREGALATRIVLGSALVMNIGIALATASGIPDEGRINNHIYGRYVALFVGVWGLVAIASLARATWRRAAVLVAGAVLLELATVGLVWSYAHNLIPHEVNVRFDAPELGFLSHDYDHMDFLWDTGLSIASMGALLVAFTGWQSAQSWERTVAGARRWTAYGGLVVLLLVNLVAMRSITNWISNPMENAQYHPGPDQLVRDAHVAPGSSIVEAANVPAVINQRHQREVYWEPLVRFDSHGAPPGTPTYVVAMVGNPSVTWNGAKYGYRIDITDHEGKYTWAVWQRD